MKFRYNRHIYPKSAVIKAAYHFTDMAYVHLDCTDEYFIVEISAKKGKKVDESEFENELLSQTARYEIYQQTKEIREISLARAMASSVVEEETGSEDSNNKSLEEDVPIDDILKDWFQK